MSIPVLHDEVAELLADASSAEDAATDAQVTAFITTNQQSTDPDVLQGLVSALSKRFAAGESRHQSTVPVLAGAMKEARLGLYPAQTAIDTLKPMFLDAVAKPPASGKQGAARNGAVARSEFDGILAWAVGQALAADLDEVASRVKEKMPDNVEWVDRIGDTGTAPAQPVTLAQAHDVFRKWLGKDYDTDALDLCLAAAAVEKLDGDPLWVLIVSGPGNAKTETVQPFHSVGGVVVGSISSEAALLSATQKRDRAKNATGGLLRKLGDRGLLVIKDVTSILSMDNFNRGRVLSALREIYDGHWVRDVGAEGGRTIPWKGRITVIGAVTTAWDTHHAVIAKMGDRFTLLRMNSRDKAPRIAAGRRSISNTGDEVTMRDELAAAVAGVIAGMNTQPITLTDTESGIIVAAADLTTLARTSVECDYKGDVIDAHDPEMPTRCAKQLAQVVRGAVAIGMDRTAAMVLAIRCARESMPPMRLAIIDYVAKNPRSSTQEVRRGLDKPRLTVDRQLQALHMLSVLTCEEIEYGPNDKVRWFYTLADDIDPDTLNPESCPEKLSLCVHVNKESQREGESNGPTTPDPDFSGQLSEPAGPTTDTTLDPRGCAVAHESGEESDDPSPSPETFLSRLNDAYGQCRDGCGNPHSPGRTRCDTCHRIWQTTVDGYQR